MQKIIFKFRDNLYFSKKICESSKFLFHLAADGGSGATEYYKNYKRFRSLRNISNYYTLSKNSIKKSNATLPRIDGMGLLDFFATLSDSSKFNYQIEYLFYKNDSDIFIRLYNEYINRLSTETSTNISKTGNDNYYFVNFFNYFSITIIDGEKRLKPSEKKREYERILNRLGEFLTKNVDTTFSNSEQGFILECAYLTTDTISAAPQKRMKKNDGYENFLESTKFKTFETNEDKDQIISILEDSSWNFYESYFKTIDIKLVYPKQLFPPSKTTVIDYLKSKIRLGELSHGDKTLKTLIDELGCKSHKYRLFSINAWEFGKFKYKESAFLETLCNKQNSTLNQVSPRGSIILFEFQTLTDGVGLPVQTEPLMFELMCLANFFEQILIEPLGNNEKNEQDVSKYIGTNRKTFDYKTPLKSWKAYFLEKTITINKDFAEAYLKRKHDIDLYYINNIDAFYNSFQPYIINNRNIIYSK